MAESFEVGEIAILQLPADAERWDGCPAPPVPQGAEMEIRSVLIYGLLRVGPDQYAPMAYHLTTYNGYEYGTPVEWLRKRPLPPKREELGEWDLCPWRPSLPVPLRQVTVNSLPGD